MSGGQTYSSNGSASIFSGGNLGQMRIQTVINGLTDGKGSQSAILTGMYNGNTQTASGVSLMTWNTQTQTESLVAKGNGGSGSIPSPSAANSQSSIVPITLSDGSLCSVVANAWPGASTKSLQANCTSKQGQAFVLNGTLGGFDPNNPTFTLYGRGPTGSMYRLHGNYNLDTGEVSNVQGTTDYGLNTTNLPSNSLSATSNGSSQSAPSGNFYLTFNGNLSGSCSIGLPDASGNLIGSCVDANGGKFSITGEAVKTASDAYQVALQGMHGTIPFSASVTYDPSTQSGVGQWNSGDGGMGEVSVVAVNQN